MSHGTSRRRLLQMLGLGGTAAIAGCATSSDQGTPTSNETKSGDQDSPTPDQLKDSASVVVPQDITSSFWGLYGGVAPYFTNHLEILLRVTPDMKLKPWLATDWKATGERTWEFTLRDGVTFHNGEPLTADAVVYSFKEFLNYWEWAPGFIRVNPDGVRKVDEMTVEFTNSEPYPTFPGTIAHKMLVIQHPDSNRENGEIIGTGPYTVDNIEDGQRVESSAFGEYWGKTPPVTDLTYRIIGDPNTRSLALSNHDVDVAFEPPRAKFDSLKSSPKTDMIKQEEPRSIFITNNLYKSPTDDVKLRKALNYAVSQQMIAESVLNGIGKPAKGPVPRRIYWASQSKLPAYPQNKTKAKQLVAESSYQGEELIFLVDTETPTDGDLIAQTVQGMLADIGVNVNIRVLEPATYDDAFTSGEGHMILTEWGTKSGDTDYVIDGFFHTHGWVNKPLHDKNGTGVVNLGGEVDKLINQGRRAGSQEKKTQFYRQALQIIMEKAAVVPIVDKEYLVGVYRDVSSIDLHPIQNMVDWTGLKHRNM